MRERVTHAKNQHYVPRLYLRRFAAERGRKNPSIYLWDKSNGKVHRGTVGGVAAELYFYERGDHGVEASFTQVEGSFAAPYQRLLQIQSPAEMSDEDAADVVVFLAAQMVRTREHRAHLKSIAVAMRQRLEEWGADFGPEWGDVSDETLRSQHVAMLPGLIERFSLIMLRMKRVLLVNHTEMPLWTSDHPVVLHNSFDTGFLGNLGLACQGIEVHFPLSPSRSLCLCDPETFAALPAIMTSTDVEHVRFLNSLQVVSSTRFLFSNESDFSLASEMLKKHPDYADPNRPRVQTK